MSYEDLKQGAYIGGSIVYDETNPDISHVRGGVIYQVRLDKRDVYAETLSFEYVQYGFLRIKSISSSEVVLDVLLYNEKGEEIVNQVNVVLAKGKEIDINGDGVADIGYESAAKDGNKREGYENANHLKFLSSKEKATRTMFMPMLNQTLGKAKHVACINSSGTMVVNFESTNVVQDGDEWVVELDAKEYPLLKAGDYLVNKNNAQAYKVKGITVKQDTYLYVTTLEKDRGVIEFGYLKISGTLAEVMTKFDPEAASKASARLYDFNIDKSFADGTNAFIRVKLSGYADIIVDASVNWGCDWEWFLKAKPWISGSFVAKVKTDNMFSVDGWYRYAYNKTWALRQSDIFGGLTVGSSRTAFYVGHIPVNVLFTFDEIGVTLKAESDGFLKAGARYAGELGYSVSARADTGGGSISSSPINTLKVEVEPIQVSVSGKASIKPYLRMGIGLLFAGVLGGGVDVIPSVEPEVRGEAEFSVNVLSGSFDFDLYAGAEVRGFCALGISLFDVWIGKKWDLGTVVNFRKSMYNWHWDASMVVPVSLDKPTLGVNVDNDKGMVTLSWNRVNFAVAYRIERYTNGVLEMARSQNGLIFQDIYNLKTNVPYTYKVYALNGTNRSEPAISGVVVLTPPPIPSGLTITPKKTGSFVVRWDPVSGAKSYKVYRRVDGVSNRVYTVTTNVLEDTDLTTNVSYSYAVSAVKWCGEGPVSSYVNAGTAPDPDQVTGISHIWRANMAITLRWNPADGAVRYRVRRTWAGGSVEFLTSGTEIEDASLLPDTEYTYTVTAQNYIKYGPVSASYVIRTPGKDDPQVVVLNLTNGQKVGNTYTIQGLAFLSNSSVKKVYVVHSAPSFISTNVISMDSGVTNWSLPVTLRVGETNTFEIWCEDYSARESIKISRIVESLFVLRGMVATLPTGPVEMAASSSGLFYIASTNALRVYDIYGNLKYSLAMPLLFKIGFSDINSRLYVLSNVITIPYLSNGIWGTNVSSNIYSIGMYTTNLQWIGEYAQSSSGGFYTYGTHMGIWTNLETLGMKIYGTNIMLLSRGLFSEIVATGPSSYYTNPPATAYSLSWRESGAWFRVILTGVSSLGDFWVTNVSGSSTAWPWFVLRSAYTTTVPHYDTIFHAFYWGSIYANYTNFRTFSPPDLPISVEGDEQYVVLMFTNRVEIRNYANQVLQVISNTFSDNDSATVPQIVLDKGYLLIRKGNALWIYK